jgi:hypothetical protein
MRSVPGPNVPSEECNVRNFMEGFRAAFPDLNFWGTADLIAEGDYVVGRWEGGGTHTGPAFSDFLAPPNAPKGERPVGGGFVWNLDNIIGYAASQKQKPDPDSCGNVGMNDYVNAIRTALGSGA